MKPGPFEYVKAASVDAALTALARFDGEARIIAGGQSLMPLMNMRMLRPTGIVDINDIPELDGIAVAGGEVRIGALTRYATIEGSAAISTHLPLVAHAIRRVADRQVRNRGTLGGSVCHADPAAQMPLCALTLEARLVLAGPQGRRVVPASEFFLGAYQTAVDPLEMLIEIVYPDCRGSLATLAQQVRRHGDFPIVSVAASARPNADGTWTQLKIGMCGLSDRPLELHDAVAALEGRKLDADVVRKVSGLVGENIDPPTDVRATAEYRRHLAPIYLEKALTMLLQEAPT